MTMLRAYAVGPDGCERRVPLDHPVHAGERLVIRSEEQFQMRVCSNCGAIDTMDEFT